jgi:hypothetical protein
MSDTKMTPGGISFSPAGAPVRGVQHVEIAQALEVEVKRQRVRAQAAERDTASLREALEKEHQWWQRLDALTSHDAHQMREAFGRLLSAPSSSPASSPSPGESDARGPMTWGVSSDEESFHGHYATKEEALAAAPSDLEGVEPGQRFWVGGGRLWRPSFSVSPEQLFETLADHASDECGEIAEDWLSAVSREDEAALEHDLHAVVMAWLKRTGNLPDFYCCEVTEAHVMPARPAPSPAATDTEGDDHRQEK